MARPRTGVTPIRHIRIPDELWNQVRELADEDGQAATGVVIDALRRHIAARKRQKHRITAA